MSVTTKLATTDVCFFILFPLLFVGCAEGEKPEPMPETGMALPGNRQTQCPPIVF